MELQACIEALGLVGGLDDFHRVDRIVFRTDSGYVVDNYSSALSYWPKAKWLNRDGRPIENATLWSDFKKAHAKVRKRVEFEWVKGHGKGKAKDLHNYAADKLAKESAQSPLSQKHYLSSVRKKKGKQRTVVGSIKMLGQTLVIFVVEVQWMKMQRLWKYRCEVMSKDSEFFGKLDFIYSTEHMRDGHFYEVKLNSEPANPRIETVIRELEKGDVS